MEKLGKISEVVTILAFISAVTTGCVGVDKNKGWDASREITVVSREDGSGTRGAFVELTGVEEVDADGESWDNTTVGAIITNNTEVMLSTVSGDKYGIGYVSLGTMKDTVRAVKVDGVEPAAENVKNGSYKISRNFNIATKEKVSEITQDFIDYILSAQGQEIIEANGYVSVNNKETNYTGRDLEGKIVVSGSSSVVPVIEKLKESYEAINGKVKIEVQQSDSSTGMESAIKGVCDIGLSSRELKKSETDKGLVPTAIAKDGIAIIINKKSEIEELSLESVKDIFTGKVARWSEV